MNFKRGHKNEAREDKTNYYQPPDLRGGKEKGYPTRSRGKSSVCKILKTEHKIVVDVPYSKRLPHYRRELCACGKIMGYFNLCKCCEKQMISWQDNLGEGLCDVCKQ
jgi:hypothetical protein